MIKYLLPVLGGSQVFKDLKFLKRCRVQILEEFKRLGSVFLKKKINYFLRDLSKVSKIWEKYFTWVPKFWVSHVSNSSIFKDNFHILIF
jgi:hypothetical protein